MNSISNIFSFVANIAKQVSLTYRVTIAVWGAYAKVNKWIIPSLALSMVVWVGYIYGAWILGTTVSAMVGTGYIASGAGLIAGVALYSVCVTVHQALGRPVLRKAAAWFAANPEALAVRFNSILATTK